MAVFRIKFKLNLWMLGNNLHSLEWKENLFLQDIQYNLASLGSTWKCVISWMPVDSSVRTSGGSVFRWVWFLTDSGRGKLCTHSWKLKEVVCPTCSLNKKVQRLELK